MKKKKEKSTNLKVRAGGGGKQANLEEHKLSIEKKKLFTNPEASKL